MVYGWCGVMRAQRRIRNRSVESMSFNVVAELSVEKATLVLWDS